MAWLLVCFVEVKSLSAAYIILSILQVIIGLGLIAVVLLQSGKSAGLSGSIAGGAEQFFGGKKKGLDELLSKWTKWGAGAFVLLTLVLAFFVE